jgi:hypothetical protein
VGDAFIGRSTLQPVSYYDEVATYFSLLTSIVVTTLGFLPFYQNKLTVQKDNISMDLYLD